MFKPHLAVFQLYRAVCMSDEIIVFIISEIVLINSISYVNICFYCQSYLLAALVRHIVHGVI